MHKKEKFRFILISGIVIAMMLMTTISALAAWSDNVSLSNGWQINFKKEWSDSPIVISVGNVSGGYTARNIEVVIHFYNGSGTEINARTQRIIGLISPGYAKNIVLSKGSYPTDTSTIKVEVFCDWQ